jgi:hypothetical protein
MPRNCSICLKPTRPTDIVVHFDHTGCEGTVDVQPTHLDCYLSVYDPGLPSNEPMVRHVRQRAADALNYGWDHPAMTER